MPHIHRGWLQVFFLSFLHNPWLWDMGEGTPPPVVRLRWRVRATWIRSHCLLFFDEFFRNASPPRQRKGWRRRSYGKTRKKEGGRGPRKRSGDHLTKSNDASHLSFGPASFLSSSPSFFSALATRPKAKKRKKCPSVSKRRKCGGVVFPRKNPKASNRSNEEREESTV